MEPAGWIVMGVSVGLVVSLLAFCLIRVLMLPPVSDDDPDS